MDIAASAMQNSEGAGLRPVSLDASGRRSSPQSHLWAFTGIVPGAGTDQATYYNLLADTAEAGADITAPTLSSAGGFNAATTARYIGDNPAALTNMHFTGATANDLLERTTVKFIRSAPSADDQTIVERLSKHVSDKRYQPTILSVGINGEVLDGYTRVRVLSPQRAVTANGYALTFSFAAANDRRGEVPAGQAAIVR